MKKGSLKRLLSYTFRYKWSFLISVFGFISFAFADIAAVEWIRRIIGFINSEEENFSSLLALSLILIALGRGIGFLFRTTLCLELVLALFMIYEQNFFKSYMIFKIIL